VIFERAPIAGAFLVDVERHDDERGFFARVWCRDEFAARGINAEVVQASVSYNRQAGTLRGLHFSWPPSQEGKLVRCESGRIFDVIVDLRPDSPTFLRYFGLVLDSSQHNAIYVPPGVAHGFQTLARDSQVLYLMTDRYRPELAGGVRFDDPAFGVRWPMPVSVISERDRGYPDFETAAHAQHLASCGAS
jgi:dTDP-4-dehydrorhamnose 3,5-epimerase